WMGIVNEDQSLSFSSPPEAVPAAVPSGSPNPTRSDASKCVAFGSGSELAAAGAAPEAGALASAAPAPATAAPAAPAATTRAPGNGLAPAPLVTSTGGSAFPVAAQSERSPSASVLGAPGCTFTRASRTS